MSNVEVGARTAQVWTNTASAAVQQSERTVTTANIPDKAAKERGTAGIELAAVREPAQASSADKSLDELIERSNSSEQMVARNLKINVDDASGKYVLSVHDAKTDEVIRQWPPEGYLKMAENISRLLEENGSVGKLLSEQS